MSAMWHPLLALDSISVSIFRSEQIKAEDRKARPEVCVCVCARAPESVYVWVSIIKHRCGDTLTPSDY